MMTLLLEHFFIAFLFDIEEFNYYEEIFKYCHEFCDQLDALTVRKISGCYWDRMFEIDGMAFCKLYLTPFFKRIGFEQVIFNHGTHEFGKDYILVTKNIFGKMEYYGVQAKAGNMSGAATSNINEILAKYTWSFSLTAKTLHPCVLSKQYKEINQQAISSYFCVRPCANPFTSSIIFGRYFS